MTLFCLSIGKSWGKEDEIQREKEAVEKQKKVRVNENNMRMKFEHAIRCGGIKLPPFARSSGRRIHLIGVKMRKLFSKGALEASE